MSLATCGDNTPWAATVFFVADQNYSLYFVSGETSRHSQHIEANSLVAATVNQDHDDWLTITGLQIEGIVSIVSDVQKHDVLEKYLRKFPSIQRLNANPSSDQERKIAGRLMSSPFYKLQPINIKLIDNSLGFGTKMELNFDD